MSTTTCTRNQGRAIDTQDTSLQPTNRPGGTRRTTESLDHWTYNRTLEYLEHAPRAELRYGRSTRLGQLPQRRMDDHGVCSRYRTEAATFKGYRTGAIAYATAGQSRYRPKTRSNSVVAFKYARLTTDMPAIEPKDVRRSYLSSRTNQTAVQEATELGTRQGNMGGEIMDHMAVRQLGRRTTRELDELHGKYGVDYIAASPGNNPTCKHTKRNEQASRTPRLYWTSPQLPHRLVRDGIQVARIPNLRHRQLASQPSRKLPNWVRVHSRLVQRHMGSWPNQGQDESRKVSRYLDQQPGLTQGKTREPTWGYTPVWSNTQGREIPN